MTPSAAVLTRAGLDEFVAALIADGYRVIGPVVRDGAIVLAELTSGADLPTCRPAGALTPDQGATERAADGPEPIDTNSHRHRVLLAGQGSAPSPAIVPAGPGVRPRLMVMTGRDLRPAGLRRTDGRARYSRTSSTGRRTLTAR